LTRKKGLPPSSTSNVEFEWKEKAFARVKKRGKLFFFWPGLLKAAFSRKAFLLFAIVVSGKARSFSTRAS